MYHRIFPLNPGFILDRFYYLFVVKNITGTEHIKIKSTTFKCLLKYISPDQKPQLEKFRVWTRN